MTEERVTWPAPPVHAGHVILEPLTHELVDLDTTAYLQSPVAITAHSAGRWPLHGFTREQNLELIARHEADHEAGIAFAYAILDSGRRRELGCAYVRPLAAHLRLSGTELEGVDVASAVATFWLIDSPALRPDPTAVLRDIVAWVSTWGAAPVVLRALPSETETLTAISRIGLEESPLAVSRCRIAGSGSSGRPPIICGSSDTHLSGRVHVRLHQPAPH